MLVARERGCGGHSRRLIVREPARSARQTLTRDLHARRIRWLWRFFVMSEDTAEQLRRPARITLEESAVADTDTATGLWRTASC